MPVKLSSTALYAWLNAAWVDLSADVQKGSIKGNWGIDENGPLAMVGDPGELRFVLRNDDGIYYPNGPAPLSGWTWGVPIKLEMSYGGDTRVLRYYLEDVNPVVGKTSIQSYVSVVALDWWKIAQQQPMKSPDVELDKRADQGLTTIMGTISTAPQATNFSTGVYTFPSIFDTVGLRTNAYSEILKLTASEFGHCYLKKDSTYGETLVFENLTDRDTGAISKTIQTDLNSVKLNYGGKVVNRATATAYPRRTDKDLQVLYQLDSPIPIKAGETLPTFRAKYIDPKGGGTSVHAPISSMQTPQTPGGTDTKLMTLLNFPTADVFSGDMTDDTGRHGWNGGDVGTWNDAYYDAGAGLTRITGGVFGCFAVLGGYVNYKIIADSHADFNFGSGAWTIGYFENRLNPVLNAVAFTLDLNKIYSPILLGYSNGTTLSAYFSSNGYSWDIVSGLNMGRVTRGKWVYHEISRDEDGWFYAFVDGKLTDKKHSNLALPDSGPLAIGYWPWAGGTYTFMGLDSFFIRKGECLHKSDFEVPRRQISATYDGDYLLNTAEDGTGTDISAYLSVTADYYSESVEYTLENTHPTLDGYVIHLQARGRGTYMYDSIENSVEDATSVSNYDYRELTLDQKYQTDLKCGNAVISSVVTAEKTPRTSVESFTYYANRDATTMANFLTDDIGDLLRVVVSEADIENYCFIQNIGFSIGSSDEILVECGLKAAYSIDPDFGGSGGGDDTDDGTVGVGNPIAGVQRGITTSQYIQNVDVTQVHEITISGIYQEQYIEDISDVTIDTVIISSLYTEQYIPTVGVPGYVEQHNLLSAQHGDTTAADVARGDIIIGQGATPKWVRLAASIPAANLMNALSFINGNTEPAWQPIFDATNPTTIIPDAAASPGTAVIAAHRDHTHAIAAAAASEIASVQAAGEGASTSFARADHAHAINHGISDNHIVTVDGAANANEYARFTANGLEGRTESEFKADFNLEIGTDVQAFDTYLTAIASLTRTDSNFIVGNGTTWVAESGATARTSLGLGTGDSPQFTAINLGHASDTTLARASAGQVTIEGNVIYRAGGSDVPVADGGTGSSTAAGARTNLSAVGLTGNETVAGVKTFSSFPLTPSSAPTTDYQAANKKYVDDSVAVPPFFEHPFGVYQNYGDLSSSPSYPFSATVLYDITFVYWGQSFYVITTNNGSHYWTISLLRVSDGATINSFDTSARSANTVMPKSWLMGE